MVYITPQLFEPDTRNHGPAPSHTTRTPPWDTMLDLQPTSGLGKRKRRADVEDEGLKCTYAAPSRIQAHADADMVHFSAHPLPQRTSPATKGALRRHAYAPVMETSPSRMYPISMAGATYVTSERRPTKQLRRLNPKIALVKSNSHLMDIEPDPAPSSDTNITSDLRPCHSCQTAPKRKRDLENYMECKRCDERTCYICARECMGCQKAICKKCIVEVGEEGDPWCLECYSKCINT